MRVASGMELKFAFRSLRNRPGFTLLAVGILGLGIGANTAIFSVVNSVLLRPLGFRDADRIVLVGNTWKTGRRTAMNQVSESDFDDLHAQTTRFDAWPVTWAEPPKAATCWWATPRSSPASAAPRRISFTSWGRKPTWDVCSRRRRKPPARTRVAVIADGFWKRRFGGDMKAIGSTVRAFGRPFTVIGIMPPEFNFPGKTDVWLPRGIEDKNTSRSALNWRVIGRLKRERDGGAGASGAGRDLHPPGAAFPLSNKDRFFQVGSVREQMVKEVKTTLWLLLGSVALVLLIACANVANLLLARATARQREIAVRAALGAGRWRIARQLLLESAIIAVAAGTLGLVLAVGASTRWCASLRPIFPG